jgi:hypothetical protein
MSLAHLRLVLVPVEQEIKSKAFKAMLNEPGVSNCGHVEVDFRCLRRLKRLWEGMKVMV